jgi:membrane-bound metal-dependent hydrolase YbcI (DUF457 family)
VAIALIIVFPDVPQLDLTASVISLLIGSVLPDIDHPSGKLRKSLRFVIFGSIVLLVYFLLTNWGNIVVFSNNVILSLVTLSILLFFSYLAATAIDRTIPGHRGVIHSVPAAAFYAALCGISSSLFGVVSPLFIAFAGGLGYLTHLISDMF